MSLKAFDHHDPEIMNDPYPVFAEMRATCPVQHTDAHGGYWVLTRYRDIYDVTHDPATFSSRGIAIPSIGQGDIPITPIEIDPPEHTRYRHLLNPAFVVHKMERYEPLARAAATRLVDGFIERGECDIAQELAKPLPQILIAKILGVPEEDKVKFDSWVHRCIDASGYDQEAAMAAGAELYGYFGGLVAARRQDPADDFLTELINIEVDGDKLSDMELMGICFQLLLAAIETTFSTIGNALWYMGHHEADRARLAGDLSLMPTAVEEFLRYLAPVSVARTATRDTEIGGQRIAEGEKLLLVFPSANRDESEFPDADRVVLDRDPNRHMAFGIGIHRCLGMHLARTEIRAALEEVLTRLPDYRIVDESLVRWSAGHVRGIRSLPITFTPGSRRGSAVPDAAALA